MQDVVDKIYQEYKKNIDETISDDVFYKYFYNLLETGNTYCKFFNRKLIKDIDEEWVVNIEKTLPHLQYVVDNPRTFIEEDRQVVNVALSKKFTPEAVKYLAQHSEMISKVYDNGEVEPNKVLNVFKEESINTYENRFIYTLLMELRTFVNKRTDVIFDNSKNEDGVKLDIDSVIDNYTEIINFKTTVRIQEKQTDLSNDSDNINIFTRISKIHKKVNDMAGSGFAFEMSKYPLVKYPVVKTNAIAKNTHYKACYELWNFVRSYDQIGYKVEMLEQDPNVSMSFENDIYNMILMNYVVVRNQMTIKDIMNIDKPLRDKTVGINMIKQFIGEIVNDFGFTESEMKNLLLTELASAQRTKEELIRKKKDIQKKIHGEEEITEEGKNTWEDFTGTDRKEETIPEEVVPRKLSKKQINRLKREKKEQERREKLEQIRKQQLEEKQKNEQHSTNKQEQDKKVEQQNQQQSNLQNNQQNIPQNNQQNIQQENADQPKKKGLFRLWKRKKEK